MAKEIRARRTQAGAPSVQTQGPSVQQRVVAAPVPQIGSSRAGLDGLSEAFGRFFGQVSSAIDSVREGAMIHEAKQIEFENAAQQKQAAADFFSGKEADESQSNDMDYVTVYQGLLAERTGNEAAAEFQQWYQTSWRGENPHGDLDAARQEWIKQNFDGIDPEISGGAHASFFKNTDQMVSQHLESSMRIQIAQGNANLESVVAADAARGDITVDKLNGYVEKLRTLDPANAHLAAATVSGFLVTAAKLNPSKAGSILGVLDKPGTGMNGKSFAESWPDAYAKAQETAVADAKSMNTMAAFEEEKSIRDELSKGIRNAEDISRMTERIETFNRVHGSETAYRQLRSDLAKVTGDLAENMINVDHVQQMFTGQATLDVDAAKKHLPAWFEAQGVTNILAVPKEKLPAVAQALHQFRMALPTDYKAQISSALSNFNDKDSMYAAIELLNAIQAQGTNDTLDSFVTGEASKMARELGKLNLNSQNYAQVIQDFHDKRTVNSEFTLATLIPDAKDDTERRTKLKEKIQSQLETHVGQQGFFGSFLTGESIHIPESIFKAITDDVLDVHSKRDASAPTDWEKTVPEAVMRISERIELLPHDGGVVASLDSNRSVIDGKGVPRTKMHTHVFNPNTREFVSTVGVYRNDLTALHTNVIGLFTNGLKEGVTLVTNSKADAHGAFEVQQNSASTGPSPINLIPGQTLVIDQVRTENIPGVPSDNTFQFGLGISNDVVETPKTPPQATLRIPDSAEELNAMLDGRLPKGFTFIDDTSSHYGPMFQLVYKPHFGDEGGMSIDEKEKAYTKPQEN
jgi:hypothetical protein